LKIPEDPFIRELLPEFVDSWISDLDEQYPRYMAEKNDKDLYRLAHTLKGSCYQFGLDDIAVLGVELMGVVKSEDWEKAATYEQPLKDGFRTVKEFLDNN